jgi:hypothetical protein
MSFEGTVAAIVLVGFAVAIVALARGISSWRLFFVGCVPAAVVVALAVREINTPCDHSEDSGVVAVLFVGALLGSLTLYAAAAVAGFIQGLRSGKAGGYGKALSYVVACPLASVLGGAVVLYTALIAALHCFELS